MSLCCHCWERMESSCEIQWEEKMLKTKLFCSGIRLPMQSKSYLQMSKILQQSLEVIEQKKHILLISCLTNCWKSECLLVQTSVLRRWNRTQLSSMKLPASTLHWEHQTECVWRLKWKNVPSVRVGEWYFLLWHLCLNWVGQSVATDGKHGEREWSYYMQQRSPARPDQKCCCTW